MHLRYYDNDEDDYDEYRGGGGGKGQYGDGRGVLRGDDGGKGKDGKGMKGKRPIPIVPAKANTARPVVPPRPEIRPKLMPTSQSPRQGGAWMQAWLWVPFVPGASPSEPPAAVAHAKVAYSGPVTMAPGPAAFGSLSANGEPECPAAKAAPEATAMGGPSDSEHDVHVTWMV